MRLLVGLDPESHDGLVIRGDDLILNAMPAADLAPADIPRFVAEVIASAQSRDAALTPNVSPQLLENDLGHQVGSPRLGADALDRIRDVMANFQAYFHAASPETWLPVGYAHLPERDRWALVRFGNVELQALENYMEFPERTRAALLDIIEHLSDEAFMYRPAHRSNHFSGDDIGYNLRMLMTNAGFYVGCDGARAWDVFELWAQSYLRGLMHGELAAYPPASPFFFKIRRMIWERFGTAVRYTQHPWLSEVYDLIRSKNVVFVSPLAAFAHEQVSTGRMKRLFHDVVGPDVHLTPVEAPVSTWPNAPDGDWAESFNKLVHRVDEAIKATRPDLVIASCGCYGVPICSHAFERFPVSVLYIGNIIHRFFGIRQNSTFDAADKTVNAEMWVDGRLDRYRNVDRIDGGRYV